MMVRKVLSPKEVAKIMELHRKLDEEFEKWKSEYVEPKTGNCELENCKSENWKSQLQKLESQN